MTGTIVRAKLTRADLALWNGVTESYSRPDASGGTVSGLSVGNDVDVLQVYGGGSSRSATAIASAVAAIGSHYATLVFAPGTWTIASNVTIPANITCRVPAGCIFSVDSGITLTFSGLVLVEHYSSWFTGDGSVVVLNPLQLPFDVRMAGIVPNNASARTANTAKLTSLLNPQTVGIKGKLLFPNSTGADTYYFNDLMEVRDGVHMDLCGSTLDFAKTYEAADDLYGFFTFIRDVSIENGSINIDYDGSAGTNAGSVFRIGSRQGYAFGSFSSGIEEEDLTVPMGNITLRNLRISTNNATHMILMLGGHDNVRIENVYLNGNDVATAGIHCEFGFWHYEATASARESSHATNLNISNLTVDDLDTATGEGLMLVGVMSAKVSNLRVNGAFTALHCHSGEALYYNTGDPYDGLKPHIVLENIQGVSVSNGAILEGSTTAAGGYLADTIAALDAGPEAAAQTDLISYSLDGFSLKGSVIGLRVSGPIVARNGTLNGASSQSQLIITDECVSFSFDNVRIVDSGSTGIKANFGSAIWSPARKKIGSVRNCVISGNTGVGTVWGNCESVLLSNCRIGYNTLYDPAAEATQTKGVLVTTGGNGVVADGCFVTTSGGAVAYDNDLTGTKGCGVRNPRGTITFDGAWERDGRSIANSTDIASSTSYVNTEDKYAGKAVYDTSNDRLLIATGALATDTWIVADASATVTPS